jgi:hypothetical protein
VARHHESGCLRNIAFVLDVRELHVLISGAVKFGTFRSGLATMMDGGARVA